MLWNWIPIWAPPPMGRSPDDPSQWLYFPEATPGAENTTKGFTEIDKNSERILPTLQISEVKTNAGSGIGSQRIRSRLDRAAEWRVLRRWI